MRLNRQRSPVPDSSAGFEYEYREAEYAYDEGTKARTKNCDERRGVVFLKFIFRRGSSVNPTVELKWSRFLWGFLATVWLRIG